MEKIYDVAEAAVGEETFGQVLRRLRGNRTLEAVAHAADISISYVQKLEADGGKPSRRVVERLEAATNAQGALIEASEKIGKQSAPNAEILPPAAAMSPVRTLDINDAFGEDTTERRHLLQLTASAAMGAVLDGEAIRRRLNQAMGARRGLAEWSIAHENHLHALRTRPPAQVVHDLAIDLEALSQYLETARKDEIAELDRVTALLASIQANAFTRMGDHGAALRWWETARWAADASGDLDLQLLVRAEEAGHGLYGQRSPQIVLRLLAEAVDLAGKRQTLKFVAAEAKALSMLGRHDEAMRALRRLDDLAQQGVRGDALSFWKPDQVYFTQSWVYSAAGIEDLAGDAREQVLRHAGDYVYQANVELHTAWAMVSQGGVEEGMAHAAAVMASLSSAFRSTHVMETAKMVLQAVPLEQRDRPAVRDVRSLLAIEA
ncbi:helix-turn-helix domain-containing protein [Nonomuraea insulae]|uniref:Helix-turn-helix domain-containing protein n=1 Tax=Nonomuraea insulae TaxID=1616787 RepID=A0ABW1CRM8_9ACTN